MRHRFDLICRQKKPCCAIRTICFHMKLNCALKTHVSTYEILSQCKKPYVNKRNNIVLYETIYGHVKPFSYNEVICKNTVL